MRAASYGPDLLTGTNRTFEVDAGDWDATTGCTVAASADEAKLGSQSLKSTLATETTSFRRTLARISPANVGMSVSKTYEVEYWIKHAGTFAGTTCSIYNRNLDGSSVNAITTVNPSTSWQMVVARITLGAVDLSGLVEVYASGTIPDQNDICYIDEVRIREVL